MPLTDAVLQRLAASGVTSEVDLAHWRKLGDDPRITDAEFFRQLRTREAVGAEYRRLLPKLLSYADARRRERPLSALADLVGADRAKCHLLMNDMEQFAASTEGEWFLAGLPNRAPIVLATDLGLLAAEHVFASTPAVVVEDTDWKQFIASCGYEDNGGEGRWYASKWWLLSERDLPDSVEMDWHIAVGCSLCEGSFHETRSHYRWDGQRYRFVRIYSSFGS